MAENLRIFANIAIKYDSQCRYRIKEIFKNNYLDIIKYFKKIKLDLCFKEGCFNCKNIIKKFIILKEVEQLLLKILFIYYKDKYDFYIKKQKEKEKEIKISPLKIYCRHCRELFNRYNSSVNRITFLEKIIEESLPNFYYELRRKFSLEKDQLFLNIILKSSN